jgi:hypothetical protein
MQWNSLKHGPAHFGAGRFSLLPKEVLEQGSVYRLRSVYDDDKEWNPNRQPHFVGNVRQPEFSHWKTAPSRWNRFFPTGLAFIAASPMDSSTRRERPVHGEASTSTFVA